MHFTIVWAFVIFQFIFQGSFIIYPPQLGDQTQDIFYFIFIFSHSFIAPNRSPIFKIIWPTLKSTVTNGWIVRGPICGQFKVRTVWWETSELAQSEVILCSEIIDILSGQTAKWGWVKSSLVSQQHSGRTLHLKANDRGFKSCPCRRDRKKQKGEGNPVASTIKGLG